MIGDNISGILDKIEVVCQRVGRDPSEIALVGVTKFADISQINEAIKCGLSHIGENKVQEAQKKFTSLEDVNGKVTRHMIGHLQTNKAKHAIENFDLIQSVDSFKLVTALEDQAAKQNQIINILLQVNTAEEDQKFGLKPCEVATLVEQVVEYKHICLQGLMAMAPFGASKEIIRKCFRDLRLLSAQIQTQFSSNNLEMKYLSMGMTDDYEIALEEGSNMIRIGRAIFSGT